MSGAWPPGSRDLAAAAHSADDRYGYWRHRRAYIKTGDPADLAAMLANDLPDLPDRYTCCGALPMAGHRANCPKHGVWAQSADTAARRAMLRALGGATGLSACFVVAVYLLVGVVAWLLGLVS